MFELSGSVGREVTAEEEGVADTAGTLMSRAPGSRVNSSSTASTEPSPGSIKIRVRVGRRLLSESTARTRAGRPTRGGRALVDQPLGGREIAQKGRPRPRRNHVVMNSIADRDEPLHGSIPRRVADVQEGRHRGQGGGQGRRRTILSVAQLLPWTPASVPRLSIPPPVRPDDRLAHGGDDARRRRFVRSPISRLDVA